MINSSDPARRRSAYDMIGQLRAASIPIRRSFAASLSMLGNAAQAGFTRHLDGGYDPATDAGVGQPGDAITIRGLSVRYGERYAFEGLTGEFAPASLTAIVGPNGAGKSSLLRALAGVVQPAAGEVICTATARHRLAFLPQQDELDRTFPITVAELVALGDWRNFGALRAPPQQLAGRALEALATVGLSSFADRQIVELSVGQFQRALFARLLLQDARVILLDEPFASLDESTTGDLLLLLRRWHAEGRTVIAVLHDLDCVRQYFPSTLLLARSLIGWGDTALTLTVENLGRAQQVLVSGQSETMGGAA